MKTVLEKAGSRDEDLKRLEIELNALDNNIGLILGIGKVFTSGYSFIKSIFSCLICCQKKKPSDETQLNQTISQERMAIEALRFFNNNTA